MTSHFRTLLNQSQKVVDANSGKTTGLLGGKCPLPHSLAKMVLRISLKPMIK